MLTSRYIIIMVAAGLLALASTAVAEQVDMAECLPADTLLYMGWNQELPANQLEYVKKSYAAVQRMSTEEDKRAEQVVAALLDTILLIQTRPVGIGLLDVRLDGNQPDIQAALVARVGDDAADLAQQVTKLIRQFGDDEAIGTCSVAGQSFKRLRIDGTPLLLRWGQHEDYFVATLGTTAAERTLACIDGQADVLAGNAELKLGRRKTKASLSGDAFFCFHANVERIVTRAKELATQVMGSVPPQAEVLIEELGFNAMHSKYVHYQKVDDHERMAVFAHITGPMKGLLSLWDQAPVTDDDLRIVPQNAYWAEVGNLDLSKTWQETLRVVAAVDPDAAPMVQGSVAMVSSMLGFSITDNLFPALGNTWAFYDAPSHGGMFMTGTVMVVETRDAEQLEQIVGRLVQMAVMLTAQEDVTVTPQETAWRGHKIEYLLVGGAPVPLAPAWAYANNRFVLGLWPQTVAAALKQIDPETRGASLLDDPRFAATRAELAGDAIAVGYVDMRYLTRLWYPLMMGGSAMAASMMAEHGLEIDLEVVPPVDEMAARVNQYVGVTHVTDEGVLFESVGAGATLAAGAVAGAAMATSITLPALSVARENAKRTVSAANLRAIATACLIYANDHGDQFPPDLDALLDQQYITEQQLQSPRDPSGGRSYVYLAGQDANSDPRNVLVYERIIGDEGTNVAFADCHVRWMSLPEFEQELRATYERLGRPAELPPALAD